MNLNEVTLIGYIGRDAETKTLPSGTQVISFSVATNSFWKDNNGEERKNTQWHNIVAYGDGFAKFADRLTKGSQVFVRGQLLTREYETTVDVKDGKKPIQVKVKKLAVEIKASLINSLERSQASDEPNPDDHQDVPE
jgi:single-strand DNA-binding protein